MNKQELLKVAKPMLFNTDMVRAILDGRKTVTRRICKDGNDYTVPDMDFFDANKRTYAVHNYENAEHTKKLSIVERACPICPGDILYVRETWHQYEKRVGEGESCCISKFYGYRASIANSEDANEPWHPSIHMPKEAARIFLKVTNVRVERLKDMTQNDAIKEGIKVSECTKECGFYEKDEFIELWNSTVKKTDLDTYGWDANPWVWVIEFEKI